MKNYGVGNYGTILMQAISSYDTRVYKLQKV